MYSCKPSYSNISSNDKKVNVVSTQGPFKNDITIIKVVSYAKYCWRP